MVVAHLAPARDYWFMFPACVLIAAVAVSAGISGATLLLPLFFLVFRVFGVPALTAPQAIGASLVLQVSAFGLAVYRYATRGLVAWPSETTIGVLSRRSLPLPVIAATATVLGAVTVGAATVTTAARLLVTAELADQAWPVMVFGAAGAVIGAEIAVRAQGQIPERWLRVTLGGVFAVISVGFVALALR